MDTKIMIATEKKINGCLEKGIKAGRDIAIAVSNLFDKWEENDEYNLPAEWLADKFDFSKQYIYKMESVAKRFLTGDNADKYNGISVSSLMEALPLSDEDFENLIVKCAMEEVNLTQKIVRQYVKNLKMLEEKDSIENDDIITEQETPNDDSIVAQEISDDVNTAVDAIKDAILHFDDKVKAEAIKIIYNDFCF